MRGPGGRHMWISKCVWRASFSMSDKALMATLSQNQICCLQIAKDILRHFTRKPRCLNSYQIKTVFMRLLLTLPSHHFDRSIEYCLDALLHRLIGYLRDGHLPHFYVPERNLIGHVTTENRKMVIDAIKDFLRKPSRYRQERTKQVCFKDAYWRTSVYHAVSNLISQHDIRGEKSLKEKDPFKDQFLEQLLEHKQPGKTCLIHIGLYKLYKPTTKTFISYSLCFVTQL